MRNTEMQENFVMLTFNLFDFFDTQLSKHPHYGASNETLDNICKDVLSNNFYFGAPERLVFLQDIFMIDMGISYK